MNVRRLITLAVLLAGLAFAAPALAHGHRRHRRRWSCTTSIGDRAPHVPARYIECYGPHRYIVIILTPWGAVLAGTFRF